MSVATRAAPVLLRRAARRRRSRSSTIRWPSARQCSPSSCPSGCCCRRSTPPTPRSEAFAAEPLDAGHEGVMVKSLDSPYQAGRRGRDLAQGQAGAHARPRRARRRVGSRPPRGWLSNLHLGARGADGRSSWSARPSRASPTSCCGGRPRRFRDALGDRARREVTSCSCDPSSSSRSPSTACSARPAIPGGVALRFARVRRYRPDKRPTRPTPSNGSQAIG